MNAKGLTHPFAGALVNADRLSSQQERGTLLGDGGRKVGGQRHVVDDVVLEAHRLLAEVIGRLLDATAEREKRG